MNLFLRKNKGINIKGVPKGAVPVKAKKGLCETQEEKRG